MGIFVTMNSPSYIHSKSTDKLKSIMSFREGAADDREEGEIIDEYEDIISSDEEFSMRQRIEELEAKNAELEKIANISAIYASGSYDYTKKDAFNHHIDRYPLISIDVSDEECYPQAPSMTRITKRRKSLQHSSSRRKMIHTTINGGHRRRKKSSSPPPAPPYRPSDKLLLSMLHEKYAARSSSKKRRKGKKSHSTKPTRKIREYQYVSDDYTLDTYNLDAEDSYENYKSSDAEASFPINRDELRLALARNTHRHEQHISLKDRLIRRKENTDTLNEKNVDEVQEIVEVDDNSNDCPEERPDVDDNMEEQELRIIALKSAVIRKHLVRKKRNENVAYSPSDFDEAYANVSVSPPINIDEAEPCMEISPVPSPKIVISDDDGIDTKPVDMDIVNSDSDLELSYEKWVPIQQIPLPNNLMMQDELYVPTPLRYNSNVVHPHFMPPDVKFETALDSPATLDSDIEEEELALRTLLLAKMNSPKVTKNVIEERPKIEENHSPDADTSLEAEALRDFLISNMKKKSQPQNSSASVLKEAVRRLTARHVNTSPMNNFVELSSIADKCQSVSAFSMTLHDAENQLSQSTADLAKIQIGQPDVRVNNVRQGWTLCKSDEECSDVKFIPSAEEIRTKNKLSTKPNKTERDEKFDYEISRLEETWYEDALPKESKSTNLQLEAGNERSVKVYTSKKADRDDVKVNCTQSVNLVKFVSTQNSKSLEVMEHDQESALVRVTAPEKENPADISLNPKGCATNEMKHTMESQGKSVKEINIERPETGSLLTTPTESTLCVALMKDKSTESTDNNLAENNLTDVKKDTADLAVQKVKSSETKSEAKVEVNEVKKSSIPQHSKVKLRDASEKIGVTPAALKVVKTLSLVNPGNIAGSGQNSASVPIQKKVTKKGLEVNVPKLGKISATISKHVKVKENSPIQHAASSALMKRESVSVAKGGKENTSLSNPSEAKFQTKVINAQNQITEEALTPKPSHLVLSTHTFHPKPPVRQSTKIVKPNKVINTRVIDLKRPLTENVAKPAVLAKLPKLDEPSKRLITTAEMPQVKKLVIQLRASDTESDYSALSANDDDCGDDDLDARDTEFMNRSITIGNEYYDIASPISLPMESPCDTPTRTASPITSLVTQPIVEKSIVNDFFEAQLDKFLKNVRSKVFENSKKTEDVEESTSSPVSTPVAVRHLPEASQQEYRRLINRMKMLERQKQAKNLQVIVKNTVSMPSTETKTTVMGEGESLVRKVLVKNASANNATETCQVVKTSQKHVSPSPKTLETEKMLPPASDGIQKPKTPEQAVQLTLHPNMSLSIKAPPTSGLTTCSISETISSSSTAKPAAITKPESSSVSQSNQKLLALYEKTYRETGNSIISNLDRSIEMVTVAKKAKMEKLKHEHRLMELRKEMEEVQRRMRQHQERITKIYPEICNSHRMIETLKTRRVKIQKDVTAFGKRIIGQSYSMNNDQKSIILEKSKKLAAEIKCVNNMKISDVEKWQDVTQPLQTEYASIDLAPANIPAIENDSLIFGVNEKLPVVDSKTNVIEISLPEATAGIEPKLIHTVVPAKMSNEPQKDEDKTEQDPDPKKNTNGHEEALENERPVDNDKKSHNSKDDNEKDANFNDRDEQENVFEVCEDEQMGGIKLQDYVSPLGPRREKRQINPNGIVCPYQLMGQCGDKDCKYVHLDN